MKLGTEVGLGPGDILLDGDLSPPQKKGGVQPLLFGLLSVMAKRLDRSRCNVGIEVGLGQGTLC